MNVDAFMANKERTMIIAGRKEMEPKLMKINNFFMEKRLFPAFLNMAGKTEHYYSLLIYLSEAISDYLDGKGAIEIIVLWSLLPQILESMTTNEEDLKILNDMLNNLSHD